MSNNGEPSENVVPVSQRTSWASFLKTIVSYTGDFSSLTAPPFILSPVSLTEFPAYWCERPELFADIVNGKTPEDRALKVLRWFISTLKGQYTTRNESMGSEKKPLNPVLGELFYGYWPDKGGRGRTDLVVEQVSHHPPITAYYISNESKELSLQGHSAQKTSFSGTAIIVKQIGHAILTVNLASGEKETYLITLPRLSIAGLLVGSPYIELSESSYIASSSGYLSTIDYSGKGYFTGKAHTFKATVTNPELAATHVLYTFEGQWNAISHNKKTGEVFTDVTAPKEEVTVSFLESQTDFETRRLWKHVADGIRSGKFDAASLEKSKIENEQRQRRKDELAKGEPWKLKHFVKIESDPEYEKLAQALSLLLLTEGGVYILVNITMGRNTPTLWQQFYASPLIFVARRLYALTMQIFSDDPIRPDSIRIVGISDTRNSHDLVGALPDGDILIHAGDLSQLGTVEELDAALYWLNSQTHPHKIFIGGSHDAALTDLIKCENLLERYPNLTYLQDNSTSVARVRGGCYIPYGAYARRCICSDTRTRGRGVECVRWTAAQDAFERIASGLGGWVDLVPIVKGVARKAIARVWHEAVLTTASVSLDAILRTKPTTFWDDFCVSPYLLRARSTREFILAPSLSPSPRKPLFLILGLARSVSDMLIHTGDLTHAGTVEEPEAVLT
ncbi:hypothetical protein EW145_g2445 [Phellinidium pouzarii]|uniref:Oxysterol-binding protein n=1 Tax=Phellinidium pouzarii TaxID=167371 RepID=A0A4S4LAU4_9AGAM|nr:hypothetical protein EW145_g2445 [Phellinidium pouzarii]